MSHYLYECIVFFSSGDCELIGLKARATDLIDDWLYSSTLTGPTTVSLNSKVNDKGVKSFEIRWMKSNEMGKWLCDDFTIVYSNRWLFCCLFMWNFYFFQFQPATVIVLILFHLFPLSICLSFYRCGLGCCRCIKNLLRSVRITQTTPTGWIQLT